MKKTIFLIVVSANLLTIQNLLAQNVSKDNPAAQQPNQQGGPSDYTIQIRRQQQKAAERLGNVDENGMMKQPPAAPPYKIPRDAEQKERQKDRRAEAAETSEYIREMNKKLLRAPDEYYRRHAAFLTTQRTGLGRIHPDRNCGKGKTVSVEEMEKCDGVPLMKGGGSLFSFRTNVRPVLLPGDSKIESSMIYVPGINDLHFADEKFFVGDESVQNFIGALGDVDLAAVTVESDAARALSEIEPSETISELTAQNQTLKKGIAVKGFSFASSAPAKLNETYVLRSIGYRREMRPRAFHNTDLLVAFKIVGREADGSIVVLWKQLKEKNAPVLKND